MGLYLRAIASLNICISMVAHQTELKSRQDWSQHETHGAIFNLVQVMNDISATDHKEWSSQLHIPSPKAITSDC